MSGKRVSRNTLEPRLATRSAMYLFTPEIKEITTISVETERMMPSSIRNERILCWRMVSSAMPTGSRNSTPRFNTPRFIQAHAPCPFYAKHAWIVSAPSPIPEDLTRMRWVWRFVHVLRNGDSNLDVTVRTRIPSNDLLPLGLVQEERR